MINFLSILLPGKCMFCEKEMRISKDKPYCSRCWFLLERKENKRCLICQRELFGAGDLKICRICNSNKIKFDVNYAPFTYKGVIESAVKRFKFAGRMWYGKHFAKMLAEELSDKNLNIDYIVYPPINRKTRLERRYNQSEILAKNLSKIVKIPYIRNGIYKTRQNEKQSRQNFKTRFSNVRGVFKLSKKAENLIKNKNILFVDDILTTGATASECAGILKKAGALTVVSTTIATTE